MAVIELGLVNPDSDESHPGPVRRPIHRPELRRLLVSLVAACCLLTVTGSARPEPRGLTQLWSASLRQDADTFRLAGDSLYVLSQRPPRLTAYDAQTGAVRWQTADVEDATWLYAVEAGVILVPTGFTKIEHQELDGSESFREFSRETTALDAATGRRLWHQRGEVTSVLGDRILLSEWDETGERSRLLRVARLRDGATVWSRESGGIDFWTTDSTLVAKAERLVTVTPRGRVEVVALTDGAVLATGSIPWTGQSRSDGSTTLTLQGRRLYLDQTAKSLSSVSVYDTDTLRRLWRVEGASFAGSFGCGQVVCLTDALGMSGHDRETGRRLWRLPGATSGYPLTDTRLIVEEGAKIRRSLVDGLTGRRLADLGPAIPVWDPEGRGTPYLVARTTQPADRMSVSSLNPATGEALVLGTIEPIVEYGCQHAGRVLACQTIDNRLIVMGAG